MKIIETEIPGVLIIEPKSSATAAAFLPQLFHAGAMRRAEWRRTFLQDNLSRSARKVLRGLHFQNPKPQGKLVTLRKGAVVDVAVDVRIGSPTFGRHVKVELNDENRRQFWVPPALRTASWCCGRAADFFYKCDKMYARRPKVLKWDDPALSIDWGCDSPEVSQRDREGRYLADLAVALPKF